MRGRALLHEGGANSRRRTDLSSGIAMSKSSSHGSSAFTPALRYLGLVFAAVAGLFVSLSGGASAAPVPGPPSITEVRASNAGESNATLEATLDPQGLSTSYHFEWGPTLSYGHSLPVAELAAGSPATRVSAEITGLAPATIYYFRIAAVNGSGEEEESSEHEVETLDACGLPAQRCFEMVSPQQSGPVGTPGQSQSESQLRYQAANGGAGSEAYSVEYGLPGATRGADVVYSASRTLAGWTSSQYSPPLSVQSQREGESRSDRVLALSQNLSCGIVQSTQPLTDDPGSRQNYEYGASNLYRRGADGTYVAITSLPLLNRENVGGLETEYHLLGLSQNCDTVLFESSYEYPGISAVPANFFENNFLYEWRNGELRNAAVVPGPSGEVSVGGAQAGTYTDHINVVSEDGSRTFFSAERLTAADPAEEGKVGIFMDQNGVTQDISGSETAEPDLGATFQYATASGSRVYFTANFGLTADSNAAGVDLYEYNVDTSTLTDRSVNAGGSSTDVGGVLGASEDGSRVYFVARAQLVTGRGPTEAENLANLTYSVYGEFENQFKYAGSVLETDLENGNSVIDVGRQSQWSSRVSPEGNYLLYETSANVTGYESGGEMAKEAYLFDFESGEITCLSCRSDGAPSVAAGATEAFVFTPLATGSKFGDPLYAPRSLVMRNGKPRVFFTSRDPLAPDVPEGEATLYEWAHGQVAAITTEPTGYKGPVSSGRQNLEIKAAFADASVDGSDLYVSTPEQLTWEEIEGRNAIYDSRVGGGFTEPATAVSCDPSLESACNGPAGSVSGDADAATTTFVGPDNHKKKHHKKKHHKKKHHKKKHHKKKHQRRGAGK